MEGKGEIGRGWVGGAGGLAYYHYFFFFTTALNTFISCAGFKNKKTKNVSLETHRCFRHLVACVGIDGGGGGGGSSVCVRASRSATTPCCEDGGRSYSHLVLNTHSTA